MNRREHYIYFFTFALVFSFMMALVFPNLLMPLIWFCAGVMATIAAALMLFIRTRRLVHRMDDVNQSLHDMIVDMQWERWREVQDRLGVGDDVPEKRPAVH